MFHLFCFLKKVSLKRHLHLHYGFTGKERIRLMNTIGPDYCFEFGSKEAANNKILLKHLKEGKSEPHDFARYDYNRFRSILKDS